MRKADKIPDAGVVAFWGGLNLAALRERKMRRERRPG